MPAHSSAEYQAFVLTCVIRLPRKLNTCVACLPNCLATSAVASALSGTRIAFRAFAWSGCIHASRLSNVDLASALLRQHPPTQDAHGGAIAHDVPAEDIALFLRRYEGHPNSIAFQGAEIADWILERAEAGELTNWTVFVANPQRERQVLVGGRPYGLVRRSLQANESIGILIDPRHEGADLHGGPENYRAGSGFNARAMRDDRPAQHGLLLLYLLDPEPLGAPTQAVLGLALSLPRTTDGEQRFVVNCGVRNG